MKDIPETCEMCDYLQGEVNKFTPLVVKLEGAVGVLCDEMAKYKEVVLLYKRHKRRFHGES